MKAFKHYLYHPGSQLKINEKICISTLDMQGRDFWY